MQELKDLEEVEKIMNRSKLAAQAIKKLADGVNEKMGKRAEQLLNETSRRR